LGWGIWDEKSDVGKESQSGRRRDHIPEVMLDLRNSDGKSD
jgi:hypothetical protein